MPFPRPRLTVRRLMIAVAVIAALMGAGIVLKRRHDFYESIAARYTPDPKRKLIVCWFGDPDVVKAKRQLYLRRTAWESAMREKYAFAARYPFFPVAPDPPEPDQFTRGIMSKFSKISLQHYDRWSEAKKNVANETLPAERDLWERRARYHRVLGRKYRNAADRPWLPVPPDPPEPE